MLWYLGIPLGFILNSLCWIKLFAVKLAVWEDVLDQYVQSIRWVPEVSRIINAYSQISLCCLMVEAAALNPLSLRGMLGHLKGR